MDIIKIENLNFKYDKSIFKNFSLNIKSGEWVTICGSNGAGKTTLIKLITGILESDCITVCDYKVCKDNLFNIRKNIGVCFGNPDNYFLCETVEEDIAFILEGLNVNHDDMNDMIEAIARKLNITSLLKKNPTFLSGGEKCKVMLACALVHNPKILILDETLAMIDEKDKINILKLLNKLHKSGLTIINIAHDLTESYKSDRLVVINNGEVMLEGEPIKVMEYDRILNRLDVRIPFEVELSLKLKLYGVLDGIETDMDKLVDKLWK